MTSDDVVRELDSAHERARAAFTAKDVSAYMATFSPLLEYRQLNGNTINRDQLARDVQSQMVGLKSVGSSFKRLSLDIEGDSVVETLEQEAFAEYVVFFFFKRRWTVHRTGRYRWSKTPEGWRIIRVEVLNESIG
jgi:hypothetical protein